MIDTLVTLPFSFWAVLFLLLGGCLWASEKTSSGIGLPVMAVLATVMAWYVIDLFYNDYDGYTQTFTADTLENAWWQVVLFLVFFLLFVPVVHDMFNARYLQKTSSVHRMLQLGVNDPIFQERLSSLFRGGVLVWFVLSLIAAFRLGNDLPYYFFPFLDHKVDPWGRGRLGSGIDALLSLASYLQLYVSAMFGIVAALAKAPFVRRVALVACAIAWPYYILDRTRNATLSVVLPAILSWTVFRLRGWVAKVAVLAGFFLLLNAWFGFIIANRSTMSITEALEQNGFDITRNAKVHHEGLNMYEELCWINELISNGIYQPNWGERYFAEAVSPIPRALWLNKPMTGIDYAVARGQSHELGDAGVGASISTGMIGQGVVNFGRILGPAFAALLMSIWVAILARLDLRGQEAPLYGLGLILTFNLGRDITLLTLYTFVFGALVVWCLNRFRRSISRTDRQQPGRHRRALSGLCD